MTEEDFPTEVYNGREMDGLVFMLHKMLIFKGPVSQSDSSTVQYSAFSSTSNGSSFVFGDVVYEKNTRELDLTEMNIPKENLNMTSSLKQQVSQIIRM